jgi:hypothetical protein
MSRVELLLVLSGGVIVAAFLAGLFFWRFWIKTRERLFIFFAVAFWALALERVLLVRAGLGNEINPLLYLVRLAAFALIAIGMLDKNRASRR